MQYLNPLRARSKSTVPQYFYQNRHLELFASKEVKRLTLRQLTFFGRSIDEERLIKSANYVRTELPVRIAKRLRDLQALPYIVVTQEGVAKVYELYWSAFEKFRRYPPINTLDDNESFCQFLKEVLDEHATVIPNLSLGLSLSSPFLLPEQLDSFMRRMLVSRISRRVLAEHHIALSCNLAGTTERSGEPHVGIIFTGLNVKRSIDKCARLLLERRHGKGHHHEETPGSITWPGVIIDGHLDTHFAYIREHLEYIVFELLKNAMHATCVKHSNSASPLPPIRATIVAGENDVGIRISDQGGGVLSPKIKSPSDLLSFSHVRNAMRLDNARLEGLRTVSSSPDGMRATVDEQVGSWKDTDPVSSPQELHSNPPEKKGFVESRPRIGIGLPMSNIFATYFGGSLDLVSLDGWGTDVYVRLPKLGTNLEDIEV